MAQLPPKVPSMTPSWLDFSHGQKILPPTKTAETLQKKISSAASQNPSWFDEFLDFSTSKRGSHRRSISDSIAFLEAPMVQECRRPAQPGADGASDFDRFDDEQFMSMFNDDIAPPASMAPTTSCSNPSSPSDHNSINDEKDINPSDHHRLQQQQIMKSEPRDQEEQSSCKSDEPMAFSHVAPTDNSSDKIVDPKRIKRVLANRQSAQRSRVRKLQYISELERSVTSLQAEVSILSPRVAFMDHQRLVLNVDNSVLKQRIAALAQDKIFMDAHQEALKREIERLRQVYYQQQNLKNMENAAAQSRPQVSEAKPSTEIGQLVN